ncbi:unnamed protein product [Pelagomonas calceolata]|uniref:Ketoreductase domain-containing protein n=1 Tax=Pelagomonas calceolata TaxID=35677 RepID=A0A7S3ZJR4_9STRA|nr:unnamed protein product [Pelagomonas calceolata]|mmetsp:Transcript_1692/g.4814  ORF Transcript_1692/g.4814 Transcript_1692/m.4814 type:complete len:591 (+) Transcript_1692:154-1926(+)
MSEVFAAWDDALYAKRKPEIISEVDGKFCCLVEWVEQPLPPTEKAIRDTIRKAGPTLPKAIIDAVPKEDPSETGKLDILAFADESGLTTSVLDSLQQHRHVGAKKVVNVYGNDDLLDAEKVEELLADSWDVVVFGAGADSPESNDPDDVVKWSDRLIKVFLTLVQIIQRKPSYAKKLFVLTTDTHSNESKTWNEAGVGLVAASHLFGMCNTCRLELPSTPIHYVDCEYKVDDDLVEQIGYEVSRKAGFGENSVRLNWRGRFVARMVLAEPRYTSSKIFQPPSTGVVGIGGGNGALGLVMGKYLLERLGDQRKTASLEIKFLSRSCKIQPAQQQLWDDVQRLAAEGSIKVTQEKCDVSSREAVEAFVSEHADRLVGFVHSAGILRDALLMNQDAEKYDAVFKPKAWAALYLNHALEKFNCDKLEFLWLFSSVATYGNPGQSPYSAANSLLDSLSRYRNAKGLPCTAMQWAGWGEVGMAAGLEGLARKRMEESPMPFFTNAQGLAGMDVGLSTGVSPFCVMRYNASAFFDQSNQEAKNASAHYMRKFWGQSIPPKELTELDVYDAVKSNFYEPHELTFAHFISGEELAADEP